MQFFQCRAVQKFEFPAKSILHCKTKVLFTFRFFAYCPLLFRWMLDAPCCWMLLEDKCCFDLSQFLNSMPSDASVNQIWFVFLVSVHEYIFFILVEIREKYWYFGICNGRHRAFWYLFAKNGTKMDSSIQLNFRHVTTIFRPFV